MDARGAAGDFYGGDLYADSGVPESQPMDFSLDPRTQIFFREPYPVNPQFRRSPSYTTNRTFAVRPIPMAPMSGFGGPSFIPPPAVPISNGIPSHSGNFTIASTGIASTSASFQPGHAPVAPNFQSGPACPNFPYSSAPAYGIRPSSLEPLPDSSPDSASDVGEPVLNSVEEDPEELEGDSDSDDSDEGKRDGSRTHWSDWQTMALIEAEKEFWNLNSQKKGREKLTAKKDKWKRVLQSLKEKGVSLTEKQVIGKWKNVLQDYRKICDYEKKSGAAPYDTLDKTSRRKEKLPPKFLAVWKDLLDSFQGDRHVNNPLCVESSSVVPRVETDPVSGPETPPAPADTRSGVANAAAESVSRANTGVKRKKDASRSASLLVDAIDRMGENNSKNFQELEKGENAREVERHDLVRELESVRQDRADHRNKQLVDVLGAMVAVLGDVARSKRGRE